MSVANRNIATAPPPSDYDVEFRNLTDDAWYSVYTVFEGEKLTVKYQNFGEEEDSVFEAKNFKSLEELEKLKDRFRPISAQLQDHKCHKVVRGVVVCVSHSSDGSDNRFYDAVVDDVVRKEHSFGTGIEVCLCTFVVIMQHGPIAGCLANKTIENLCLVQSITCFDPNLQLFLKMNTKRAKRSPCKKRPPDEAKMMTDEDDDLGGDKNWSILLIDNKLKHKSIGDVLKVVCSGSEEYATAKQLRNLFMEFTEHQQLLHKRLAMEERKILQASQVEIMWRLRHYDHVGIVTMMMLMVVVSWSDIEGTYGFRFAVVTDECMSHNAPHEGDTLHVSFVVVKADDNSKFRWHFNTELGVDLVIKGPSGEQIHDFRDKTSEKFEFVVHDKGVYTFCFTNKSPFLETIDFDVQITRFTYYQHAKDVKLITSTEHFAPLLEHISKLEEALNSLQFEQKWLEAHSDRQAFVRDKMSRAAIHKAVCESLALPGASLLQVYFLKRLLGRKVASSRS
ncbi:unnamed protein product [Dovyalis caffra]|uniref:GOLD domain-containing protein n=1 Tax=Dovyalis caffra TaxID=77055 RepID=A0AAV1SF73_9ROSI|nr:unnamed protein product [Dovyalis caffra]